MTTEATVWCRPPSAPAPHGTFRPHATWDGVRRRRLRVCCFNTWADRLEPAESYLARIGQVDLRPMVADPDDAALLRKARLDCDWYAENVRCIAALQHAGLEFLPALVAGPAGLLELPAPRRTADEEAWLLLSGHQPQKLAALAGSILAHLRRRGVRIAYYAFDEASAFMPCFREVAPHLDVLIHDESPLDPAAARALRPGCVRRQRSWVANLLPFAAPFNPAPEPKILFLGSQLGLTPHRVRQIQFLQQRFQDRFVAHHDHSVDVADRLGLNRYKVGFCPEGRKFTTAAMSRAHTDRPFWSGCLGLVPVTENSREGHRLDELAAASLILRYPHNDFAALAAACERALAAPDDARRRIYDHFNRHEIIGVVLAEALAAVVTR